MTVTVYYFSTSGNHDDVYEASTGYGDGVAACAASRRLWDAGQYTKVAETTGHDLDYAYKATQNGVLSDSWSQDPPAGLTPLGATVTLINGQKYGNRSSMMGDIFEVDGVRHLCVAVGFKKLEV